MDEAPVSTAPVSTAPAYAPASQEVLRPEDYDLAAEISQFTEFINNNWESDLANKFKFNIDNKDDSLFMSKFNFDSNSNSNSDIDDEDDNENPDLDSLISFALPPLTGYTRDLSKNEILSKLNTFAKDHGFALVTRTSKSQRKVWYFGCDQCGEYRNTRWIKESQRKQKTTTRANDCKFEIRVKLQDVGDWEVKITYEEYNHKSSQDFQAHPTHRRAALISSEKEFITNLYESDISTRVIKLMLHKKYGFCPVTSQDLYNLRAAIVSKKLGGRSPIQVLIDEIAISL